jgi:tRNA threonylcarbamoyladenosine biosynthesis protein TsaB
VAADGAVRASAYEAMRTGHAEALVPMIQRVLAEAGIAAGTLERIAVTHGPGTFAGIRIGLAAAEGLRLATGAPIVPVSSLWAIGQRVLAEHGPFKSSLAVAVDAGRDQVYLELLDDSGASIEGPSLVSFADARPIAAKHAAVLAGSGAKRLTDGTSLRILSSDIGPRASDIAVAALALPASDGPVRPLYFRPADAVVPNAPGLRA